MFSRVPRAAWRGGIAIAASVVAISLLHYSVNVHLAFLHVIFSRLYYVPIIVAAVVYGTWAALATSVFASLLYLPHVIVDWSAWPVVEANQYGELVVFNAVALVTGALADRLRAERNRYEYAVDELQGTYAALEARAEERLRVDRQVTIGRLAAGVAHAIRNPLGGLIGCLEILEADFPRAHPKREFFKIARNEVSRLGAVVTDFLEFAQPTAPASRAVDLSDVVRAATRLAQPALSGRCVALEIHRCEQPLLVEADEEQLKRALINLVLEVAGLTKAGSVRVTLEQEDCTAVVSVAAEGVTAMVGDLFEPFSLWTTGRGLGLAIARRLIENQRGSIQAEQIDGALRCAITLPVAELAAARPSGVVSEPVRPGG